MTIRYPSNVKNILASGIDSLVISTNTAWKDTSIFIVLDELKKKAQQNSVDYQGQFKHFNPGEVWPFTIKPNGTKGFSWIISGADFTYKIANSVEPGSRPNVMIEIRSEALWRLGTEEVIKIALSIIEANGGHVIEVKPSRVDLCVDFIMSKKRWSEELKDYAVTRAIDIDPHYKRKKFTGISIGKGVISARLYDKPLEIQRKSNKYWMFDIWGIKEVPEGKKIIRIEFELRREIIKEIGINVIDDLFQNIDGAWAYCTRKWLKFQDHPELHHTQQLTLRWYEEIQNGFNGVQDAKPLVRKKAVSMNKKKLMQQVNGLIIAIHAIDREENKTDIEEPVNMEDCVASYNNERKNNCPNPNEIKEKILRKRAKFHREEPMNQEGQTIYRLKKNEK